MSRSRMVVREGLGDDGLETDGLETKLEKEKIGRETGLARSQRRSWWKGVSFRPVRQGVMTKDYGHPRKGYTLRKEVSK